MIAGNAAPAEDCLRQYGEAAIEKRGLAPIQPEVFTKMKNILFGAQLDPQAKLPLLDGYEAGIMLEVVKDLLYEAYVRKGKLQQAIMVRRFFLDETGSNVTPFVSAS